MARYILIDNHSGFIFGDSADLVGSNFTGTPIAFARAMDASNGEHGRQYRGTSPHSLAANETGYHVYSAAAAFPVVENGQDQETIAAVMRDCEHVGAIRCTSAEA